MKRIIFLVAALLTVFSGIAAVSAYEGHMVDVKAHVENAIGVQTYELSFGTVFPQENVETNLTFGLSNSFVDKNQKRVSSLDYKLFYELKPIGTSGAIDPDGDTYFEPLSPFILLSDGDPSDANDTFEAQPVAVPGVGAAVLVGTGKLTKVIPEPANGPDGDLCDILHFAFKVPVFDKWYNAITDPLPNPYKLIYANKDYEIKTEKVCGYDVPVPQADLGINLKIQVISINAHVGPVN